MRKTILAILGLVLTYSLPGRADVASDSKSYDLFAQEYTAWFFGNNGPAAVDLGLTGKEAFFGKQRLSAQAKPFTVRWPDWSPQGLEKAHAYADSYASRLNSLRTRMESLSDDRKVGYNMMTARNNLSRIWFAYDLRHHLALACPSLLSSVLDSSALALENNGNNGTLQREVIQRLGGIPPFIKGCMQSVEQARAGGRSLSKMQLEIASGSLEGAIGQLKNVAAKVGYDSSGIEKELQADVTRLKAWSENCLTCEEILGEKLLRDQWKFGYGRSEDPFDVSARAHKDLARLHRGLVKGLQSLGPQVVTGASSSHAPGPMELATSLRRVPANLDQALASYRVKTAMALKKAKTLFDLPEDLNVQVLPPPETLKGLGAAYKGSAIFGTEKAAGYFYVDDSNLAMHHELAQRFITAHEVAPGHALQIAMFRSLRNELQPVYFLDGSSDVLMGQYLSHENMEGWGLFAEILADEVFPDFYSDGERVYLEQSKAWRAARAYIEPLVQSGKMTMDEAAKVLYEQVLLDEKSAKGQARSFFLLPLQRSSYYIGAKKIHDLRAEVAEILGKDGLEVEDYPEFHRRYFRYGMVPISLFREALLNEYREETGFTPKSVALLDVY